MKELTGYLRPNGKIGIRNHILVISAVSCSNTVAEKIARATDTIPIVHDSGCMDYEEKIKRTKLCLIKAGQHPNVGGVLVVGLGCEQISAVELATEIETAGKPVRHIQIHKEGGSISAIRKGIELVKEIQKTVSQDKKVPIARKDLVIAVQCGGSDWTSAIAGNTSIGYAVDSLIRDGGSVLYGRIEGLPGSEGILAKRAVNPEVGNAILKMVSDLKEDYFRQYGQRIEEVNPTPGNKEGGITTLVEKSIGNIKKGGTSQIQGLLKFGEQIPHPGMWFINARLNGPDMYGLSAYAIHGAHVTIFSSGLGNPIGCAFTPVIKLTGNSSTYAHQKENFDFNAGQIIEGKSIDETGEELYQLLLDVAGGKLTITEELGYTEFAIPYDPPSIKS